MRKFLNKIISYIYPNRCISCGKVQKEAAFCDECRKSCRPLPKERCAGCNQCVLNCTCSLGNSYEGLVSAYLYAGTARDAILHFKFHARPEIKSPFGEEVARLVCERYKNIKFDGIVFVPMTRKGVRERGYNQCELLSLVISEELGLPIFPGGLVKIREGDKQRKLSSAARKKNVKSLYKCMDDMSGKTILLIDDIKTTGSTLNACANELKKAGAVTVYACTIATAL